MNAPLFSVVIPVHNRADRIAATVESLFQQTLRDWEAVIVDDGSRDGEELEKVIGSFGDERLRYVRRTNGGAAAARNTGIDAARGKLIALLDSDDHFLPCKLEIAAGALADRLEDDVVFFSRMYVERGVGKRWLKPPRGPVTGERIDEYLTCTPGWIQTSTVVLPAALARRVRFDERLPSSQDTDFAIRCASAGAVFLFHPDPLVILDDRYDPSRVSKQRKAEPLLSWIDSMRGTHVSERSYWAYRGWQCARIASFSNRLRGIGLFLPSALRGVYPPKVAATVAAQVLIPQGAYQRVSTMVVALLGRR